MVRKAVLLLVLLVLGLLLSSCQTVEGVGGDIQWSAQKSAELMEGN